MGGMGRPVTRVKFVLVLAYGSLIASSASAQTDSDSTEAETAERLFREAGAAYEAGNLGTSQRLLERSLATFPTAATAINLAQVSLQRGSPVRTAEIAAALLAEEYGRLSVRHREIVEALRDQADEQLGSLTIVMRAPFSEVLLDGRRLALPGGGGSIVVPVNPDSHVVLGTCPADGVDGCPAGTTREEVHVAPGGSAVVELFPPPETARPNRDVPPDDSSVWESPWLWLAAAAATSAGVVAVVGATGGFDASPEPDPNGIYPVVEAVRW